MVNEPATIAATTEKALRERIHRLFCGDGLPASPTAVPPRFWVGPTEEQKSTLFMDIEERIVLSDDMELQAEAQSDEQRWLNSPHVGLDGMSPEAMLAGGKLSRQRLCAFVAAIEVAVREGSFS